MPAAFVAHGAPLLATDRAKGAELAAWSRRIPAPSALLVFSAHWEAAPVTLGTVTPRPLMYDFSGFPPALYQLTYAAPGAPELAKRVSAMLEAQGTTVATNGTRPLDHGVWVPLLHMWPEANVPILQGSLPTSWSPAQLFALGEALAPLREEGVLILGSGNLTHNLRRIAFRGDPPPEAWAAEFDAWIGDVLARRDWDALRDFRHGAPALRLNHPTEEHLLPLLVTAGAGAGESTVSFPVTGWEFGNLSRRSVQLG